MIHGKQFGSVCRAHACITLVVSSIPFNEGRAQRWGEERPVSAGNVVAANILIGGVTAATRAWLQHKNARKAFMVGSLGGAIHVGGKFIGTGRALPSAFTGSVICAAGTSIVSNGGAGRHPLEELSIPVAMLRIRFTPRDTDKVRFAINVFETGVTARLLARDGLAVDWRRTAQLGTFVFITQSKEIVWKGEKADGVAWGSVVTISEFSDDPSRTMRHEAVHMQQYRFAQEAWGRPTEDFLRRRVPKGKWFPIWLELGVLPDILISGDELLFGRNGPFRRAIQSEAEMFERR